ncbi:YcbK family protein [Silvibacterium sp.]|uniref:YcbK family protein n=1 Tax=Silvibacterium sp. TaxID=1964179 RepID=UPI0039E4CECE
MPDNHRQKAIGLRTLIGLSQKARRTRSARAIFVLFAAAAFLLTATEAHARPLKLHKHSRLGAMARSLFNVALPSPGLQMSDEEDVPDTGERYELKLARSGDGQTVDVVYRIGDVYIPEALDQLNQFLCDSHNGDVPNFDPRTFDLLHTVLAKIGRTEDSVDILSAYRSQETNDMLRLEGGTNAALHSQHIVAKALDIRVPGVSASLLRVAALSLHAGGVGYYPTSQFVHIDVGPVREWNYSPRLAHKRRSNRRHVHA